MIDWTKPAQTLASVRTPITAAWSLIGSPRNQPLRYSPTSMVQRRQFLAGERKMKLTQITEPFSLLDAETKEALRVHGGPYEFYSPKGRWVHQPAPRWHLNSIYRVKPNEPVEIHSFINWNKPVQTIEDGNPARVVAADYAGPEGDGKRPILAIITYPDGSEVVGVYTQSGEHSFDSDLNLVNMPEKHVRWVNMYPGDYGNESREEADRHAAEDRIACVRVEFEEGEGL